MPNYKSTGAENLRSSPKTFHAAEPEQSSAKGKDVGGRGNPRANEKVLRAENPKSPKGDYGYKVDGIQTFTDGRV